MYTFKLGQTLNVLGPTDNIKLVFGRGSAPWPPNGTSYDQQTPDRLESGYPFPFSSSTLSTPRRPLLTFSTLYVRYVLHKQTDMMWRSNNKKGKVLPYSLPSVGPGAHPGVQAVSPQVTISHSPAVGCHYFPPGLRFTFVSIHQMAPTLTAVTDILLQLTTHLSTPKEWQAEFGLVGWPIADGLTTYYESATGRVQDQESSPARDRRSTAEPRRSTEVMMWR